MRILNDDLVVVMHVLRVLIQLVDWFDRMRCDVVLRLRRWGGLVGVAEVRVMRVGLRPFEILRMYQITNWLPLLLRHALPD